MTVSSGNFLSPRPHLRLVYAALSSFFCQDGRLIFPSTAKIPNFISTSVPSIFYLLFSFGIFINIYNRCMSDSREGEHEEALTRENDELIARCSRNFYCADENNDGDYQIDHELLHQQHRVPLDQRKGKNKNQKDKKLNSNSNRGKMQVKAKKFVLSCHSRFDEHLEVTKKNTTEAITRRSAPPFPYNGEDFGGSPSRYLCFIKPSIPPSSSSPIHTETAAAAKTLSAENTAKPKSSSHYDFVKSLIETNDFYSPECNAHRDIPSSQVK